MRTCRISILTLLFTLYHCHGTWAKSGNTKGAVIDAITDIKDFKKLLRTKTNVLVCYSDGTKQLAIMKAFRETAIAVKGLGTMILIDCSGEARKMCKKLKVNPEPYLLKHYKDGEFYKDYDRLETVPSMVNFMRDPTGDIPWEEDASAKNVMHVPDATSLAKFLKRESKPIMIMFYAPWCGFCKTLKPEYANAADDLRGESILAAIDVNRPENSAVRTVYNITGFPTLLYYENGELKYTYEGENNRQGLVHFMRNPHSNAAQSKKRQLQQETDWSETDSEVVHLTASSFEPVLREESSVLVMFYAPWCGHCKKMKPDYESAAAALKSDGIPGMLAAVDATKESALASKFNIRGYPTLKYFSYGEEKWEVKNARETPQLVNFMRNPQEPPPPAPPEEPWSEQLEDQNVVHLDDSNFKSFLKKKKHVLVMFYAPWCGHCKRSKPEFSRAAEHFKDDPKVEFAAVDCTTQQALCNLNDVKGYPTFKYFSYYSKSTKAYSGSRTDEDFIRFMSNPEGAGESKPTKVPSATWEPLPHVIQLTDNTFKKHVSSEEPVLVMFYAPWCGHCKRLKPDYAKAAAELKSQGVQCKFAMVDCTENPQLTERFEISGFPTLKLFKSGKFVEDYNGERTVSDLTKFMRKFKKSKDEL